MSYMSVCYCVSDHGHPCHTNFVVNSTSYSVGTQLPHFAFDSCSKVSNIAVALDTLAQPCRSHTW